MKDRPLQLPLDLGHVPAHSLDDFLAADSNHEARNWILRWPAWPGLTLALAGPAGCGKTHLAHVWKARSGANLIAAAALSPATVQDLADGPGVIIEDADQAVDEVALFHLYNLLKETGRYLLLTGREAPSRWPVALADLRSRLATIPLAFIRPPDESLLEAVLLKLFSDRQLPVGPDVLAFILPRMERSFAAAQALVAKIDGTALAGQRRVTVPLVRGLLNATEDNLEM